MEYIIYCDESVSDGKYYTGRLQRRSSGKTINNKKAPLELHKPPWWNQGLRSRVGLFLDPATDVAPTGSPSPLHALETYASASRRDKHCHFTIKFERPYANLSLERNSNSPVKRIPLLSL